MLFDSHNHLQSGRFGKPVAGLVRDMKGAGIAGCVVNATREGDWEAVAGLAREFPGFVFPAYGIHPWYADTAEEGWEQRLRKRLENDPLATVGEVGVDGWVDSPAMEVQMPVFVKQAQIAAGMGRVMTVHCLKAWEQLFSAMDQAEGWPEKFLMHSFGGSIEVAERLLKKGAWFSFSGYFLQERKAKVLEVFRKLPHDRILLETDAPDMMPPDGFVNFPLGEGVNHPANLCEIAGAFERELGAGTMERIWENGRRFRGEKKNTPDTHG
ncbi:TatD family hydrolase [Akkermansiaceae bacterium]|nr:TatD family hydrolase [Akkermansiaceae bacterium]